MNERIKIVIITETLLGGIRQHIIDIIDNIDNMKFEIYLIYSELRTDEVFLNNRYRLAKKANLVVCNDMRRKIGLNDIKAIISLTDHLKRIQPDIVHCHSSKAGLVGRIAASHLKKNNKKPYVIYTPHAYAFQNANTNRLMCWAYVIIERYLSKFKTDMTINVSKGEMEIARKKRIDRENKFTIIHNGIIDYDIGDKNELKRQMGFKCDRFYIGQTARCAEQKNPMLFLRIAEEVVKKRSDVVFLYVGDGELYGEMTNYVMSRELEDKIKLVGFRSDANVIVGAFDIYLSTALYEGMPYSMIEAMRAGVPLIATNVIGNNEIVIDGVNGNLYELDDVESAVRCILSQLDHRGIDSETVKKSFAEEYSLRQMIQKTESIYLDRTRINL